MEHEPQPAWVKRIDYAATFRLTRLFDCFRMAISPSRLTLALLLIVSAYLFGRLMDAAFWGDTVIAHRAVAYNDVSIGEWEQYRDLRRADYREWREKAWPQTDEEHKAGVFEEVLRIEVDLFQKMVRAAIGFRPGFAHLAAQGPVNDTTVIGALRLMTLAVPGWLIESHLGFVIVYMAVVGMLWALLAGAITRQMVVAAAVDRIVPMTEAVTFATKRWATFLFAPIVPLIFVGFMVLALWLGGLVFYIPGLNIIGALGFFIALGMAFVMTLLLVLWFGGVHMVYPAVCAQGSDALDAVARAFGYVWDRPWRLFFYSLIALVYGAATYIFVGLFVYLMIALAQWATGLSGGLDEVFPTPTFGRLPVRPDQIEGPTDTATSVLVYVWVYLLMGVLGAFAISFYLAAYSQIYLLLRQSTDGDDPSDVFEPQPPEPGEPQEKVEPPPADTSDAIDPPSESQPTSESDPQQQV